MKTILEYLRESNNKDNDIKQAMLGYIDGSETCVNKYLRNNKRGHYTKKELDAIVTKMDPCFVDTWHESTPLYRTVDWDFMKNLFGITQDNLEEHIGDVIQDKAYMSTTDTLQSPWGTWTSGELVFIITANDPIACFDVNQHYNSKEIESYYQNEILLPRGTKLRIDSYEIRQNKKSGKRLFPDEGTYFLKCTVVK